MINKIYLHWTAGRYDQLFNDYHICIDGDGVIHRMANFETKLAHTWRRNSNAVGIAICCCYGATLRIQNEELRIKNYGKNGLENKFEITWDIFPPKEIQVVSMVRCVAGICKRYGLPIRRDTVMTHAEVADSDGYGIYDDDPDMRWDLLRLPFAGDMSGGDYVRYLAYHELGVRS